MKEKWNMWSDKFDILKTSIKVLLVAVFMALMGILLASNQALGYLTSEVEPGIVEMRQAQNGALVVEKTTKSRNGKWLYLVIAEKTRLSSKIGASSGRLRYFYAPVSDFNLQPNMKIEKLQYGIKARILNFKGRIPFGQQKYFYRLVDLKTLS